MKVYADVFSRPKILGKHKHLKINQRLLPQPETYPINQMFKCSCTRRLGQSDAVVREERQRTRQFHLIGNR